MNQPMRRGGGPPEQRRRPPWGLGEWNPFTEFENLWRDMTHAFEGGAAPVWGSGWVPAVEEDETDDAYVVRAELPGIPRENISVDVDDHELQISGELTEEQQGRVLSRRAGRFFYRTSLPSGVDAEKVEAELTDGILTVRLPKSGAPKRRRISIGGKG
ncbi:Hsp20/alpha crystallin family protein [Streptomyces sp. NBC_00287]|uniref:Hsp20/alpha crystallin family protein n=1 Tax=Streptomyces sp. NBC_00287 TaxID=2975702 RepID=UPI002E2CF8A7|nr:Hsp20/alpha crystallin family protein [Streptomyces sp. NBC_00287]